MSRPNANAIALEVERAIMAGELVPGRRLPAIRARARNLGVSPATVAAAYRMLSARGLIAGAGRHGTIVSAGPPLITRPAPPIPPGVRNLAAGGPDPAMLPELGKALAGAMPARSYGEPYNVPELVEIAAASLREDGAPAGPVAIVSGALDGIERLMQANLRAGDRVAIEDPGYPPILDLLAAMGLQAEPLPLDDSGPLPDGLKRALDAGAAAAIITPRAQNPTGAALDPARVHDLRAILSMFPAVMIIEDDHAGPVAGAPFLTLCEAGRARWAIVRSLSKSLGPDLRVTFITGDALTIGRLEGRQRLGPGWVSHLLQHAALSILRDRMTPRLVARASAAYARRREWLIEALAAHDITARGRSGLNVWIPVAEETAVTQTMISAGWGLSAGARYRLKSPPGVRVSIATLTRDEARRLAADFARALAPARRVHHA
jgi:DNA-binding transcriptional MocR family regulator